MKIRLARRWLMKTAMAAATVTTMIACGDEIKSPSDVNADTDQEISDTSDSSDTPDPADVPGDIGPTEPTAEQLAILGVAETRRVALPGLTGEVHVLRTAGNIPNIYAENRLDLARVAGFIQASDRFFFMDLQRRLGLGTISSLLGDVGLGSDIESRGTGITAIVDRLDAHISNDFRAYLGAFAEGVNAYIAAVAAGTAIPPSETDYASLLGYDAPADMMAPFAVRDVLALVAVVMHSTNFETDDVGRDGAWRRVDGLFAGALKQELRRTGYRTDFFEDVRALFPGTNSTDGFGLTGSNPTPAEPRRARAFTPAESAAAATRLEVPFAMIDRLAARLEARAKRVGKDREAGFGSNVWAIAGTHTADGAAILANDGHLELSIPPLAYAAGLNTKVFSRNDPHPPMHQMGGWLGNFPVLIGGTNGKVAFGGVNPVLDITDWYREEIRLDSDGYPKESLFNGEWKPLQIVEESFEVAEVALLESVGRTEKIKRYMTFDGRWLTTIEGRRLATPDEASEGDAVVNMLGDLIVPGDTAADADDTITAISFDYTALDATRWPEALFELGMASNVEEVRQATKGFIGSALFMSAVDDSGSIFFTTYQAVPCRAYLPRTDGVFAEGADPTRLIDGTRFGGFTIVSDANGKSDELAGADDPYRCVIPLDTMPHAINPPQGHVFNANSDPAGITDDGDERNGLFHIGGPWSSVRGNTIMNDLNRVTADKSATVDDLVEMQANIRSRLGEVFVPFLLQAITRSRDAAGGEYDAGSLDDRLGILSVENDAMLTAVAERLENWATRGFVAHSGVETFYTTPTEDDRADAVATMIFNAWFPRFLDSVWNDENITAWRWGSEARVTALKRMLDGRGENNPGAMASWDAETSEAVFFDRLGTEVVENSDELMLQALVTALSFLESTPGPGGTGGFGTNDMAAWLWGLRHVAKFQSIIAPYLAGAGPIAALGDAFSITTTRLPLMPGLAADDPRKPLKWFPRGGDQWSVDAANPGLGGVDFSYGSGAAMRIVVALKPGEVRGRFILPGGQSGLLSSEFFDDQVQLWLGNEYHDIVFAVPDVVAAATGREVYVPSE